MATETQSDLSAVAEANVRTSTLLLVKEALITAIQDRRLERGHLRILAAIGMCMSSRSAKAWPSRAVLASMTGLSVKTVSNNLLELRTLGYLVSDRETVEEAGNRRLIVYTFGNIDHETIRNEITKYVMGFREDRDHKQEVPRPRGSSPHMGNNSSPPAGKCDPLEFPARGEKSSPPAGIRNSKKELCNTSPYGDGAKAPETAHTTFRTVRKVLWDEALAYLKATYGSSYSEKDVRQRLGKMLSIYGEGSLILALAAAQKAESIDPINYMEGVLKGSKPLAPSKGKQALEDRIAQMLASETGKLLITKHGREEAERIARQQLEAARG